MDVLSPFIPVLCHSDSSTESPVHVLTLSIQAVRGLPRLRAPGNVPCIISFSRQLPLFPHHKHFRSDIIVVEQWPGNISVCNVTSHIARRHFRLSLLAALLANCSIRAVLNTSSRLAKKPRFLRKLFRFVFLVFFTFCVLYSAFRFSLLAYMV